MNPGLTAIIEEVEARTNGYWAISIGASLVAINDWLRERYGKAWLQAITTLQDRLLELRRQRDRLTL